jgi:putative ABC transport system permease protein
MIRHLFKMIWNKKKQNSLLIVEMLVSFLVVFAVFTLVVYNVKNYNRSMGFKYENVWAISFSIKDDTQSLASVRQQREAIRNEMKSMPEIKGISYTSSNFPFAMSTNNGTLNHNKQPIQAVNNYTAEEGYADVLQMEIKEGRWLVDGDDVSRDLPVVINSTLKEKAFGSANAIGQFIGDPNGHERRKKVVGVVEDMKFSGDFQSPEPAFYQLADTGSYRWLGNILIRVDPTAGASFEARLHKRIASALKDSNIEIEHLSEKRKTRNNLSLIPMIILLIVAGFLIINVALGLFGVLWYNINRRRGEIGLRRAVGATGNGISRQLVGEAVVLSTLALIVGSFFALQFPLLQLFDLPTNVYLLAWLLSLAFIYLLVMLCAFYPGKQAAAIMPAVALHEE